MLPSTAPGWRVSDEAAAGKAAHAIETATPMQATTPKSLLGTTPTATPHLCLPGVVLGGCAACVRHGRGLGVGVECEASVGSAGCVSSAPEGRLVVCKALPGTAAGDRGWTAQRVSQHPRSAVGCGPPSAAGPLGKRNRRAPGQGGAVALRHPDVAPSIKP
jgi:hypothetical protein